ncbi:hypothetical protein TCAL_06409 [Tigriopus californicus]|uniref:DNA-directed RNA polymerases I and III subunit RPAC1 n=2 Tax=Tigriopus californicus TaxID=6832 RepID=A0A553PAK4_TIGCA|nr:hypothetical protein TCAL_06409 [Tigriopus californicus]|eukprot:TCALIF_06409-PA protein Name:"Similar to Polr1c DNA-directed RNA polymerases I and III subunit RPAC1 (Mus musculus)" AED:0.42 eAED:0.42 QI:0/-1/0/1/-1/1/1/0/337
MEDDFAKISLKQFEIANTSSAAFPGTVEGQGWTTKDFERTLKIRIVKKEGMDMEFDLIGVDPSLANAFRRILISEIPSMAIEKVYMHTNTSIIQDEVLAHRLGLVPLKADPRLFAWKGQDTDDFGTDKDTLEFEIKVKCSRITGAPETSDNKDALYQNHKVESDIIKWIPKGDQSDWLSADPGPVEKDILLSKMRPGHEMDIKLYAYKGLGRDHAKFSPVATAYYRLLPEIKLNQEVSGEAAERLQKCFSPGVIELKGGNKKAVVKNARYDACSRNVFRHDDLKDTVTMDKVRDHFIFTIESVGAITPDDLFRMSIDVLEAKVDYFLEELDACLTLG